MITFWEYLALTQKNRAMWVMPEFEKEKNELVRQANELNLDKEKMFDAFHNGKLVDLDPQVWSKMQNTESNHPDLSWEIVRAFPKDVDIIIKGLQEGHALPAPIVLKYKGNYWCVAGNTRLSISKLMNITPKVWMITYGDDFFK